MITVHKDTEGTTTFRFEGTDLELPRGFTPETDSKQIEVFHKLCLEHETQLLLMTDEYQSKLAWNHAEAAAGRCGLRWPIFGKIERFLNKLQKQAGIVDT